MCFVRRIMVLPILLLILLLKSNLTIAQDYEVSDIQCTFADGVNESSRDSIIAILKKPENFKGNPLFADDRDVNPETSQVCQIRQDPKDQTTLKYTLRITDFTRCGVVKRSGYVHVRVWFPQFPGVVMQSDQELIIMCKPPEKTIIENKAAGFAGSFPAGARVSGVVEESPGRLEYEVALYKEAPARINNVNSELPVDQAVPIGTKLQLRARINPDSAWKYVKLMEVTVSPDPEDPHRPGSVSLVRNGCKNAEFNAIIPHQPTRYREKYNEVFLDFEAFLLSTMKERSTLWIHSQIKACMDEGDCEPEYCLGMHDTTGHGRRRREVPQSQALTKKSNDTSQYTKFSDNIKYSVLMPGEFFQKSAALESSCSTLFVIGTILGCLLSMSAFIMWWLASRLHAALIGSNTELKNIDQLVRESRHFPESGYTGRAMTQ